MKEKLVIKADRKAVILDQFWPIAVLLVVVAVLSVILFGNNVEMILLMDSALRETEEQEAG